MMSIAVACIRDIRLGRALMIIGRFGQSLDLYGTLRLI